MVLPACHLHFQCNYVGGYVVSSYIYRRSLFLSQSCVCVEYFATISFSQSIFRIVKTWDLMVKVRASEVLGSAHYLFLPNWKWIHETTGRVGIKHVDEWCLIPRKILYCRVPKCLRNIDKFWRHVPWYITLIRDTAVNTESNFKMML